MVDKLQNCTRKVVTSEKCLNCPIAAGCGECFPAGTLISTPNGLVNIEDIKVGDKVYDMNGDIQKVSDTMTRIAKDLVCINGTITTYNHPFLNEDNKWIKALDLKLGDKVKAPNNQLIAIISKYNILDTEMQVYNFSVENTESYIANNFIVHNCAAYSWQVTNRIDQRVEYICLMHQARALANVYY